MGHTRRNGLAQLGDEIVVDGCTSQCPVPSRRVCQLMERIRRTLTLLLVAVVPAVEQWQQVSPKYPAAIRIRCVAELAATPFVFADHHCREHAPKISVTAHTHDAAHAVVQPAGGRPE